MITFKIVTSKYLHQKQNLRVMKKYLIASFLMVFSMSFKQQQDSTKTKQDSIRKADLTEIKNRLRNVPVKTSSQRDFSEQFKPSKNPSSNYIYKDGRIVGGKTTLKTVTIKKN